MVDKVKKAIEDNGMLEFLRTVASWLMVMLLAITGFMGRQMLLEIQANRDVNVAQAICIKELQIKEDWQDSQIQVNTDNIKVLKQCSIKTKENFSRLKNKGVL